MKIGFIGAGKVGFTLGKYFETSGLCVGGYYSRSITSSKEAAAFTSSKIYNSLEELIFDSDLIFITTPDREIELLWHKLNTLDFQHKLFCHCSGSLTSKVFYGIDKHKSYGYSLHPIYAFSDKLESYKNLNKACFSLEGPKEKLSILYELLQSLGHKVYIISAEQKISYHLSNVMVSNLLLSLLNLSCSYFDDNLTEEEALLALWPLIENNLKNIKEKGFINSLTGPVERGDIDTICSHLGVLKPQHINLYKALSLNLASLSMKKHSDRDYSEIIKVLGGQ